MVRVIVVLYTRVWRHGTSALTRPAQRLEVAVRVVLVRLCHVDASMRDHFRRVQPGLVEGRLGQHSARQTLKVYMTPCRPGQLSPARRARVLRTRDWRSNFSQTHVDLAERPLSGVDQRIVADSTAATTQNTTRHRTQLRIAHTSTTQLVDTKCIERFDAPHPTERNKNRGKFPILSRVINPFV
jgi:hypothetical protein